MKILVLDNYDSFTYNLVGLIRSISSHVVEVRKNDEIAVNEVEKYDKILISPGPGLPDEAGSMKSIIARYATSKSILGICLGMQGIAEVFQSSLTNLEKVYHGKVCKVRQTDTTEKLFRRLPGEFEAGRYHSWIVQQEHLSKDLKVTAIDENNIIMAIAHNEFDVKGVQFHPESVMTPFGKQILTNWLSDDIEQLSLVTSSNKNFNIQNLSDRKLFC